MRVLVLVSVVVPLVSASVADAEGLELKLVKSGANVDLSRTNESTFNHQGSSEWSSELRVTCNWACTAGDVTVADGGTPVTPKVATVGASATMTYALAPLGAGTTARKLDVTAGGKTLTTSLVQAADVPAEPQHPPATAPTVDLASLAGRECALPSELKVPEPYNRKQDVARVIVAPNGVLLSKMPSNFDENDSLQVTVYADPRVLAKLKVVRASTIREVQSLRIVGSDAPFSATDWVRHGKDKAAPPLPPCQSQTFYVGDFSPGRAEVTLSLSDGTNNRALGSFEFLVNPVYSGIFSFGAIWTTSNANEFAVLPATGQITNTEIGKRRLDYVFFYTPYVWGKRDIEKGLDWYEHINPTVAVALTDLTDNGIAGLSVDLLNGFVLTAGVHVRRVKILDPASGLSVGSAFSGTSAELPIAHRWETGSFWGISVDLRAAVQITRTLLGTATQAKP